MSYFTVNSVSYHLTKLRCYLHYHSMTYEITLSEGFENSVDKVSSFVCKRWECHQYFHVGDKLVYTCAQNDAINHKITASKRYPDLDDLEEINETPILAASYNFWNDKVYYISEESNVIHMRNGNETSTITFAEHVEESLLRHGIKKYRKLHDVYEDDGVVWFALGNTYDSTLVLVNTRNEVIHVEYHNCHYPKIVKIEEDLFLYLCFGFQGYLLNFKTKVLTGIPEDIIVDGKKISLHRQNLTEGIPLVLYSKNVIHCVPIEQLISDENIKVPTITPLLSVDGLERQHLHIERVTNKSIFFEKTEIDKDTRILTKVLYQYNLGLSAKSARSLSGKPDSQ